MLTFDTFYPSDIHITDQTLLLNIETTGLSPRNAFVFMIGLGWQEEKGWHFQCLLADVRRNAGGSQGRCRAGVYYLRLEFD